MKALYQATIFHKRYLPVINRFLYRGIYIKFSLNEKETLKSHLFGLNTFNLFSFYDKDHGNRDGSCLKAWANKQLELAKISACDDFILQTFPRILGYVFKPVSFWYCYKEGKLKAIICEVNNTFGENHNYVLHTETATMEKDFHVSPFFKVEGQYRFNFKVKDTVLLDYIKNSCLQIRTFIKGSHSELNDKELVIAFLRNPFFTFMVPILIHYQALKLFLKKVPYYTKPNKKKKEISYEYL